jgi:ribosomal protein S1
VRVLKLHDYGAVVQLPTGLTTLLHISQLSWEKLRDVRDVLQEGQVRRAAAGS